jgi:hypothetical protein
MNSDFNKVGMERWNAEVVKDIRTAIVRINIL